MHLIKFSLNTSLFMHPTSFMKVKSYLNSFEMQLIFVREAIKKNLVKHGKLSQQGGRVPAHSHMCPNLNNSLHSGRGGSKVVGTMSHMIFFMASLSSNICYIIP